MLAQRLAGQSVMFIGGHGPVMSDLVDRFSRGQRTHRAEGSQEAPLHEAAHSPAPTRCPLRLHRRAVVSFGGVLETWLSGRIREGFSARA
jgi:hypothetical protein